MGQDVKLHIFQQIHTPSSNQLTGSYFRSVTGYGTQTSFTALVWCVCAVYLCVLGCEQASECVCVCVCVCTCVRVWCHKWVNFLFYSGCKCCDCMQVAKGFLWKRYITVIVDFNMK